jgi:uncharacterized protein (TIGR03118 family)
MKIAAMLAAALLWSAGAWAQTNNYTVTVIVNSSQDPFLINPWGLSRPTNPNFKENEWWVSDNVTGLSTLYFANKTGSQSLAPLVVTIPSASGSGPGSPTGTAYYNLNFAFATLDGTISNWNALTPGTATQSCAECHTTTATIMVDHSASGASYQGLTLAKNATSGAPTYYAANANGGIEAYDAASFSPVTLAPGAFTDSQIPASYTPAGIQAVGSRIYVTYNLQSGGGAGYVDAYSTTGKLLLRFQTGHFNQPWGVAQAPANFGVFSRTILIGNTGNGAIGAYNPSTGKFAGWLLSNGHVITLPGLWGLEFGDGNVESGPTNVLYFNAGGASQTVGEFGAITAN